MCSIYEEVFIVPKAGILIPVLPDKSEEYFTQKAIAYPIEFYRNFWVAKKVKSDPFFFLMNE